MSKGFMWTLGVIGAFVAIIGFVWASDSRYVQKEINKLTLEQMHGEFEIVIAQIQQQMYKTTRRIDLGQARSDVDYWRKEVARLRGQCAQNPNNPTIQTELLNALRNLSSAEAYLKSLEKR